MKSLCTREGGKKIYLPFSYSSSHRKIGGWHNLFSFFFFFLSHLSQFMWKFMNIKSTHSWERVGSGNKKKLDPLREFFLQWFIKIDAWDINIHMSAFYDINIRVKMKMWWKISFDASIFSLSPDSKNLYSCENCLLKEKKKLSWNVNQEQKEVTEAIVAIFSSVKHKIFPHWDTNKR